MIFRTLSLYKRNQSMNQRDKQLQVNGGKSFFSFVCFLLIMVVGFTACNENANTNKPVAPPAPTTPAPQPTTTPSAQPGQTIPLNQQVTMEVAKAVMVTVELDFDKGKVPSIADALKLVERQSKPDDGQGRTFSILDAYGE